MSVTESPRLASCNATDVPTMPAPRTIASVRCAMPVLWKDWSGFTYRIRTRRRQAWLICRDNCAKRLPGDLDAACRAGRSALLARPARNARRRGIDLYRHCPAAARGAVQTWLSHRAIRAFVPRVPACRPRRSACTLFASAGCRSRFGLDDAGDTVADRVDAR